jgi:beta-galactosidase
MSPIRTPLAIGLTVIIVASSALDTQAALKPQAPRQVISLDGEWQVGQGDLDTPPAKLDHTVPVPGLLDMAEPAFEETGKKSPKRQAFWYRRTFKVDGDVPAVARLKIHKAKYGMKVWLNGQVVGESLACFTPVCCDVKKALLGGGRENELVVRVGADRDSMPQDMPTGWDFEKYLYIPGIYDSVELILTGRPYITNVQIVPNIDTQQIRVVAEIDCGEGMGKTEVSAKVTPAKDDAVAGQTQITLSPSPGKLEKTEFSIPIPDCRLWSPEDPFLYQLTLSTGADAVRVRFGMRSFRFDPETKMAILNGKPYYLRGSNVTLLRFFEDDARGDLPWRNDWVRKLHQRFKSMHWNSLRYCIGFAPEAWYDIADEEGILIQDEFPIWLLSGAKNDCPEFPAAEKIVPQYTDWMRERWNHPCVVIWDAQNESNTPETGKALQQVRHLDLSNRPWENGWAEPQAATDCVESHPYLFIREWSGREPFRMSELATTSGVPRLNQAQKKIPVPIIINEYAWLWLTRDGNPTCLTDKIYASLLGPESTVEQRRRIYARYLAALTEFWRAHRQCAGVVHFCGLGYSRPGDIPRPEGGATSDHWIDVENLEFEPLFEKYVRDSFSPVGVMLDFWAEEVPAGSTQDVEVYVVNDTYDDWQGDVRLVLQKGEAGKLLETHPVKVKSLGREILTLKFPVPTTPSDCTLIAELDAVDGKKVRSLRDFESK